jgi:hypothetical protein
LLIIKNSKYRILLISNLTPGTNNEKIFKSDIVILLKSIEKSIVQLSADLENFGTAKEGRIDSIFKDFDHLEIEINKKSNPKQKRENGKNDSITNIKDLIVHISNAHFIKSCLLNPYKISQTSPIAKVV